MKLFFIPLILLTAITIQVQAQFSSIGLRAGGVSGVSFKYVDDDYRGFELIAGAKEGGFILTGLLQKYRPVATGRVAGFHLYTGGGAHAGYSRHTVTTTRMIEGIYYYSYHEETDPVIGGDFIFGAEYHFESIPLHLSLDYKPYVELFGEKTFRVDLWDIGFTIRYAFNQ